MAIEFIMPKLGLTMEEGTISEWLAKNGDEISPGDAVLRIETDKTETDVEASSSGRLHVIAEVGDTFACGDLIGWFLADGEQAPTPQQPSPSASAPESPSAPLVAFTETTHGSRVMASPLAKRIAREQSIDISHIIGTGPGGRIVAADLVSAQIAAATPMQPAAPAPGRSLAMADPAPRTQAVTSVAATVAARQLADLLGIELTLVPPDPSDNRISRAGVARHVRALLNPEPAAIQSLNQPVMQTPSSTVKMTGMRGTIAKRMHGSLQEMAQLTLHMDADLDAVVSDRERRKLGSSAPSYTDYVIAATARALAKHPVVNSQITDDGLVLLPTVHVGMAVALEDGLIVPVVSNTADRDLASLSNETARLAAAARDKALSLPELEGGTFSVSTLGMFGVDGFTPVINPPNTAILGVGRLRDDVVVGSEGVTTVKRLTLSLTWDHRAFDGAPAAQFCQSIVELLAEPAALDQHS